MFKYIDRILRLYSKNVLNLTFVIFIFILRKTFFNIQRDIDGYQTVVDSSTSLSLFGIVLGIIFLNSHLCIVKKVVYYLGPFLLYYFIAWLSFFWAEGDVVFSTITFKVLENVVNIFMVGAIAFYIRDGKKLMYYIILFSTASTLASLTSIYMKSGFGIYHTNAYTISALIGMLLCIGCIRYGIFRFRDLFIPLSICTYAWITGTSTASYISFIIGLLVLLSSRAHGVNIVATIIVTLMSLLAWHFFGDYIYDFVSAGHSKKAMESGTGRDQLWTAAISSWRESPWLGKGYIVGETMLGGMGQKSAHNSFVSALVGTGIIGTIIFVFSIIKCLVKSYLSSSKNIYATITFPVLVAVIVNVNSCPVIGSHWSFVTDSVFFLFAVTFINYTGLDSGDTRTMKDLMATGRK